MTVNQSHLTEDELDGLLMGCAPEESSAHLLHCALCAGRLEEFRSSVSAFNQAATAWSEARSNALTRDLEQHRAPFRITAQAAWTCASLVVLAGAIALGLGIHERSAAITLARIAPVQMAAADTPQDQPRTGGNASSQASAGGEMATDDAMLRQIDAAIDTAEPSPEELYGIADSSSAPRQDFGRAQVKD